LADNLHASDLAHFDFPIKKIYNMFVVFSWTLHRGFANSSEHLILRNQRPMDLSSSITMDGYLTHIQL